ncbi:uncharacterized protein LOC129298942 isoform X1 [Prosopis cineraria]|uniref:uncharacterized protein LOC129298942 isoform X1 n=1 Tax=Prosopis cineraria TaxID=364024 RepID=UPI0024109BDB|nr:uncharacterized protein LOC129298942 isoform X1 [Prosopis cineraria]
MSSSAGFRNSAIPHRQKHRNSFLFRCNLHKKRYSFIAGLSSPVNFRHRFPNSQLSARKLAAGLWQLRFMERSGSYGGGSFCSSKSELANEDLRIYPPTHHKTRDGFEKVKDHPSRLHTVLHSRNGTQNEIESSLQCLKCCKEEATKWDTDLPETSNQFPQIHDVKHNEERNLVGDSIVSALLAELLRAQRCINKLKAAKRSSKKKAQQFVHKFEEEMIFWKQRELKKFQSMLDEVKDKLGRERRSRERMELMNAKLLHKLAEANQSAKHFMKNYEEEKRGRELMEEVCNELAKQVGEDKCRLEELEIESMKILKEVEEERKMMQISEHLREERVHMKLLDAKLALEEKYNQMIQFFAFLQNSLRSEDKNQGIVELSCDFLKFDDISSIYEELRNNNRDYEKVIKPCEDGLNNHSTIHRSNSSTDYNAGLEVVRVNQEDDSPETLVTEVLKRKACSSSKLRPCLTNGTTSTVFAGVSSSMEGSRDEGRFRHWESEAMNPHITRGMKGCIEWPRGVPKSNLKAVPLDAKLRSQRSQLQHILKSKA